MELAWVHGFGGRETVCLRTEGVSASLFLSRRGHAAWLARAFAGALGERVAKLVAALFREGKQPLHFVGISARHVGGFADVRLQVVQLGFLDGHTVVPRGRAV